ncbi:hypothetical protein CAEBREN_15244 [Caenorhabditis brenneri]|uniref:Uncharacterized protein n=1 Tax=Caenorhabditis brenneri TaxID=135651 RepID=G0ND49_CAEBE|nr:hypothetical protein CAEBREN_15244 [Caenorhabditis brenneri]
MGALRDLLLTVVIEDYVQTRRERVRSFGALAEVVAKDRIYRCVIKGLYTIRNNLNFEKKFNLNSYK